MLHELDPACCAAYWSVTTSESPAGSVEGPPPVVTVKSPQEETTFRMSEAVPGLRIAYEADLGVPNVVEPKSSDVTLNTHWAPGACSAATPTSATGGTEPPSESWQADEPTALGV